MNMRLIFTYAPLSKYYVMIDPWWDASLIYGMIHAFRTERTEGIYHSNFLLYFTKSLIENCHCLHSAFFLLVPNVCMSSDWPLMDGWNIGKVWSTGVNIDDWFLALVGPCIEMELWPLSAGLPLASLLVSRAVIYPCPFFPYVSSPSAGPHLIGACLPTRFNSFD